MEQDEMEEETWSRRRRRDVIDRSNPILCYDDVIERYQADIRTWLMAS